MSEQEVYDEKHQRYQVNAINYKGEPVDLLKYVNDVRLNKRLKDNPLIPRFERKLPKTTTNLSLWKEVSIIMLQEFEYWKSKPGYYPDLTRMIFRSRDTFVAGSWHFFVQFWLLLLSYVRFVSTDCFIYYS